MTLTAKAKKRNYHVMAAALAEENRVIQLAPKDLARRSKEIWESCFGADAEDDAAQAMDNGRNTGGKV